MQNLLRTLEYKWTTEVFVFGLVGDWDVWKIVKKIGSAEGRASPWTFGPWYMETNKFIDKPGKLLIEESGDPHSKNYLVQRI